MLQATDNSCELGFNCIAFLMGHRVQNLGFLCNTDNGNYPEDVTRFQRLSHSWEFIDGTVTLGQAADERREAYIYICAAPECRIEMRKKATLNQCAGSAPNPD